MKDIDARGNYQATAAHLRKSLRALHMAHSVALRLNQPEDVIQPLRAAIHQVHVSLDFVTTRETALQALQSIDAA